ncbi:MAG TPA: hypothetical protein VEA78_00195, partial [Acidimicrobiales bacterium]|nr:hypothetical protein [Acidimicrobiales bacterium]
MTLTWHEWTLPGADGWAHHGVAALPDGTIAAYHPGDRSLLRFDADGALVTAVPCDAVEAHDIALDLDGDALWLADCGHKLCATPTGDAEPVPAVADARGAVLLVGFDGRTRGCIESWHDGAFLPTGVAPEQRGVWIADGYGSNRVDLVAPAGEVLVTIDGLDCPHGVRIDTREDEPRLCIAERGAHRLAVHDLDGAFVRHDGVGELVAPCSVAFVGDLVYVADLAARVTVLDRKGRLVEHIGVDADALTRRGWPNARADDRRLVRPPLAPGRFNSPHGITVLGEDVVVTEWLLGGRWVRARRSS